MLKIKQIYLIGITSIALLGTAAPVYAQATDVDCIRCVDTKDIAAQAVTAGKMAPLSVTTSKIDSKAVTTSKLDFAAVTTQKLANQAVATSKIQNDAVTQNKIAPNAVGITQINPSQVQQRVTGVCASGSHVRAISQIGSVTCEAGADGHSLDAVDGDPVDVLFVDADGDIGIGTSTPNSLLTVSSAFPLLESENTTANMRWRFGTDSSGNFIINKTTGTTYSPLTLKNNGQAFFTRDSNSTVPATPCTTVTINNTLPGISGCIEGLMIGDPQGGAVWIGHDTNLSERLTMAWLGFSKYARLDSTGGPLAIQDQSGQNVGIGTSNPSTKLEVIGTITASAFVQASDSRLKRDIRTIVAPTEKINQLRGVTYYWDSHNTRDADDQRQFGLIAQEVATVIPEAISQGAGGMLYVNYDMVIPILVEAVGEQQMQLKELAILKEEAADVDRLRAELAELRQLVQQMASLTALPKD